MDRLIPRLEQLLPAGRVAFHRLPSGQWEARTLDGDAGHGDSLGEAIENLIAELA